MLSPSRYRERDNRHVVSWVYTDPKIPFSGTGTSQPSFGKRERMWDCVTPDFKKKSSKGSVVMSPLTHWKDDQVVYVEVPYSMYHTTPPNATVEGPVPSYVTESGGELGRIDYGGGLLIDASRQNALKVEAAIRCLSQIRRTSTENWENIAEAGKTLKMLEKPVGSWLRFNRKFQLASAGLSAANAWLAYRYGVKPLISSIEGIVKESFRSVRPLRQTTRTELKTELDSVALSAFDYGGIHRRFRSSETEKFTVRCTSIDEALSGMSQRYGLSTKSLLTLPWELLPYSFVIDWLVNVGDFVGALAQAAEPASLGRCEVWTWDYTWTRVTTDSWCDPPLYGTPGKYSAQFIGSVKTRYPGLTSPGLTFKNDFRFDTATRLTDSIALIGQQILRRFK